MVSDPIDAPPASDFQSEPESAADAVVRKTPWWAISVGLHALAVLVLTFFWVIQPAKPDIMAEIFTPKRKAKTPVFPEVKLEPTQVIREKQPVEHPVYVRDAKPEKHNESDNDEIWRQRKGKSLEFASNKPFDSKAALDVIGTGRTGGGSYGTRLGGKKNAITDGGGGGTQDAVLEALKWLARHQNPGGSWSVAAFTQRCTEACTPNPGHEDFDAGVTGLSLLAFLGAGYSHLSKDVKDGICFGDVVRKGMQWMMSHQDPDGCIGSRNAQKYMYNHTLCALAMSEAYGLTGSNLFRDQAQKCVDFIVASQNPGKGWRYQYKSGDNDSSVTGWAVMVLKSAELSGLAFPPSGYDGTRNWYDEVTQESYGQVGYTHRGTGKVFVPGLNEQFDHHEALTAIGVMARIFMDKNRRDPLLAHGADLLLRDLPRWEGNAIDFYYWYYASLALFQYDGPKGSKWKQWNEPMKNALVKNQNVGSSGCRRGSWEPVGRWCGEAGRVYATAINALTLEVYYRYANVFGNSR